MATFDSSFQKILKLFFASRQFWLCNIIGWLVFDVVQSLRDSFDGSALVIHLIKHIPTVILGIMAGLGVRALYKTREWHNQHPINLIPTAALIAIIFALANVAINHFDVVLQTPEICSREHSHTPNYCGIVSDYFIQSMEVMLVWCLLYFLIKAERKTPSNISFTTMGAFKAIATAFFLLHTGTLLSTIAYLEWGNTYYLFSNEYFLNSASSMFFTFMFSSYILFIKPGEHFFGSQILPLIPTLCVISFCCATLTIGAGRAPSLAYYLYTQDQLFSTRFYLLFFGLDYGGFTSKSQLAGVLQGTFTGNLITALCLMSYRLHHWKIKNTPAFGVLDTKKTLIFWCYNIIFWLAFGSLLYATDLMDLKSSGSSIPLISTLAFTGIGIFMGTVLRSQIYYVAITKAGPIALSLKILVASLFMGLLLTSALWFINYTYIFVTLNGHGIKEYVLLMHLENFVSASTLASCVICGLWSFICYMIESQHIQRNATIKQLQIEMNMKEVQLNALAGKVDPHFVFNALNNIRALIDEDSEKARSAIVLLSDILRSPITVNSQKKITIDDEITLVRSYISLSKIQFEDRLIYLEDVSADSKNALIPSMMLQILAENAIKHGISQLPDGGMLSIQIHKREQQLVCTITNHGKLELSPSTSGFGVGIKVIQDRLALLYNDSATFNLREENQRVIAELIFPFETSV